MTSFDFSGSQLRSGRDGRKKINSSISVTIKFHLIFKAVMRIFAYKNIENLNLEVETFFYSKFTLPTFSKLLRYLSGKVTKNKQKTNVFHVNFKHFCHFVKTEP